MRAKQSAGIRGTISFTLATRKVFRSLHSNNPRGAVQNCAQVKHQPARPVRTYMPRWAVLEAPSSAPREPASWSPYRLVLNVSRRRRRSRAQRHTSSPINSTGSRGTTGSRMASLTLRWSWADQVEPPLEEEDSGVGGSASPLVLLSACENEHGGSDSGAVKLPLTLWWVHCNTHSFKLPS
jgi:hypothetical protein